MTLADFLVSLAEDPDRLAQLIEDPQGFIGGSELDERQRELLLGGDLLRIRHVVEYELGLEGRHLFFIFVMPWLAPDTEAAE